MTYKVKAVRLSDQKVLFEKGNLKQHETGLGHALLLYNVLTLLKCKKLNYKDLVTISKNVAGTSSHEQIQLKEGNPISLFKLLQIAINFNSIAAILALSEHLDPTRKNPSIKVKARRDELGLDQTVAINLSGRQMANKHQAHSIDDILTIGRRLFVDFEKDFKLMNTVILDLDSKIYEHPSFLNIDENITASYFFGQNQSSGVIRTRLNEEDVILGVMGARDAFHRDYIIKEAMARIQNKEAEHSGECEVYSGDKVINFLGDTYFGEFYTKRRQKRNQEDALMRYGYDHSLKGLQDLFEPDDYNIINFEAVFTEEGAQSKLQGMKPFLLWANEDGSLKALEALHLNAVSLGNNHAMDFGVTHLNQTMKAFEQQGIRTFGAGMNGEEAIRPLHLKINHRNIYIYNGYWYRKNAYRQFDFYAMGNQAGVAPLNMLTEDIQRKKQADPNSFIIVQPHWGVDFRQILTYQAEIAEQLIESGCDLILGHGPHTIQRVKKYKGVVIVYSMGNGVFNSNGEFDKYDALPYGFVTKLKFQKNGEIVLRLLPFDANNLHTFWCPTRVNEIQFKQIAMYMQNSTTFMRIDEENQTFEIKLT